MIVTRIIGGLGNQMFQYAYGRFLAEISGQRLKLDLSGLDDSKNNTKRHFGLGVFNISIEMATKAEINRLQRKGRTRFGKRLQGFLLRRLGLFDDSVVSEGTSGYRMPPAIGERGIYLSGYWQSEKYFKDTEEIIREEFTLKDEYSIEGRAITQEIISCNAISLHVRRGDYVSDKRTNEYHGTCSLSYYEAAMKFVTSKVENPHLFIFSDDIEWVKENLKIDHPVTYVSDGKLKDYEELMLMSYCKHNIIANSSFSWWGAWLNRNSDKIVIAPKKWFNRVEKDIGNLIPKEWYQL